MPNWCENELDVIGSIENIKEFMDRVEVVNERSEDISDDTLLSFNKIIPMPLELRGTAASSAIPNAELIQKYGYNNWYDWSIANWDTKWDACNVNRIIQTDTEVVYDFDTAWSPPIVVIIQASVQYPKLTFTLRYFEGGAGFKGSIKCKNGKILKLSHGGYRGGRGG